MKINSPARGVSWDSCQHRWRAYISVCGHRIVLGYFGLDDVGKAISAVREARAKYGDGWAAKSTPEMIEAAKERARVYARGRYRRKREQCRDTTRRWLAKHPDYAKAYRDLRNDPVAYAAWKGQKKADSERKRRSRLERQRLTKAVRTFAERAASKGAEVTGDRGAQLAWIMTMRSADRARCYWCDRLVPKSKRRIDHIIPLDKGGPDDVANLCCACVHCNSRKSNKLPHEFSGQHLLF